ncbi:MAG: two-component system, OmpR family, response regulator BaeR [Betaproteobacteria bacterium]|jgi:two-component system response regulator BaeR|nr:two-component system, OmpR family, response regulator BaeR [Betaproteobacteria bacterium]
MSKVLIVEDEPKLASLVADYLKAAGYEAHCIENGLEAIPWVKGNQPDLIVLDLMLPGRSGLEICKELRTFSDVPVIMVTARVEEVDRLIGLEVGADDYLCKPFSVRELVARVKALLRRPRVAAAAPAGLAIDEEKHQVSLDGKVLDLTPVEFRLLAALVAAPGRVFSRDGLLEKLYADHRVVTDRTVDAHVKNLRRKLEEIRPGADLVRSIYGVGYKLEL